MKRTILFIIITIEVLGASASPQTRAKPPGQGHFHLAASPAPCAELESTLNVDLLFPVNPFSKNLPGGNLSTTVLSVYRPLISTGSIAAVTGVYSKNYLYHIYPSLHFW